MQDLIGYDEIIENSMRSVIYETLKRVEKTGLPGGHYFIVTFLTKFKGIKMNKSLLEKYPEEMTIAIQHQYRDLKAEENEFQVSLSFSGVFETIKIPYKSITSFTDPSINFGLKFSAEYEDYEENEDNLKLHANIENVSKSKIDLTEKVISLDAFRKTKNSDDLNKK